MRAFAEGVLRYRLAVLVAWAVLLAGAGFFAGKLGGVLQGGTDQIPGSESQRVTREISRVFGPGAAYQFLVVLHSDSVDCDDPAFGAAARRIADSLRALPEVRGVRSWWDDYLPELLGSDGRTALMIVTPRAGSFFAAELTTPALRRAAHGGAPAGFSALVTGTMAVLHDLDADSSRDLLEAEKIGLPITLLILVLVFGAPLAAALPILLALAAVSSSFAGLYFLARAMPVSVFAENAVSMIGLGVGIDYALFILSRCRHELQSGHPPPEAIIRAVVGAGEAVLFSGATVAVGFLALFLLRAPFLDAIALGGTFVVLGAVAAALTLLPALLSLLGGAVHWPRRIGPRKAPAKEGQGPWARWALLVMRRPWVCLAAGAVVLAALVLPVGRLQNWSIGASNLPPGTESRRGYELLAANFPRGWMGPFVLLLEAPPGHTVWEPRARQAVLDIAMRLYDDERVAGVQGFPQVVTTARSIGLDAGSIAEFPEGLRSQAGDVVSGDGRAAQILVFGTLEPQGQDAKRQLAEMKRAGFPEADAAGLAVSFGGVTASLADFDQRLMSNLPRVAGAVLALTFVVLLVLFRSLVIPLKATLLNLLSVLAAYGFLVLVFQDGHGASLIRLEPPGGLNSFIVLMLFTILFGLSMDYEVFLLSRVREEYLKSGDTRQAVAAGLERTAGTITSAALIMISIFLAFGFTRMIATREFGLGLAFAVALDATLIRVVMVPALMAVAGPWNWWLPGRSPPGGVVRRSSDPPAKEAR